MSIPENSGRNFDTATAFGFQETNELSIPEPPKAASPKNIHSEYWSTQTIRTINEWPVVLGKKLRIEDDPCQKRAQYEQWDQKHCQTNWSGLQIHNYW